MDPLTIGIIGSAVSGIFGGSSAKKAAAAQAQAARDAATAQLTATRETNSMLEDWRAEDIARFDPFYGAGVDAQNALRFEMGLGPAPMVGATSTPLAIQTFQENIPGTPGTTDPRYNVLGKIFSGFMGDGGYITQGGQRVGTAGTPGRSVTRYRVGDNVFDTMDDAQAYAKANATTSGGQEYGGFTASPGYQFRLGQGLEAVQGSAAARHGLASGAAMQAMNEYGQNFASNEYGNYFNRLAGLAGNGQNAAGQQGAASINYGTQIGQNTIAGGNALAQGIAGAGNANAAGTMGFANSLQNAFGQGMGLWQTQNLLKAFQPSA